MDNYICNICKGPLSISLENILVIHNTPESTFKFSDKTIDLNVAECKKCGAVQLFNVPLSPDYAEVYRSIGISSIFRENKKKQLETFLEKYNLKNSKIIEVGCGDGQYLEIFQQLGTPIYGIEVGKENYKRCLDKGFSVSNQKIFDQKEGFDAFCCFHYLEHIPEPIEFVSNLYRILYPGGIGLIEVPNYDYIEKNKIWLEFTKDHRFYFRKKSLLYLLISCGFNIESIEDNQYDALCLTVVVRKPSNDHFLGIKKQITNDIDEFKELISKLKKPFAVYGAGHYSQLMLNNLFNKYGIRPNRIFDSNKQKCGNHLCGILIEHKDEIVKNKDFKSIVIICGIYNKEVQKMLIDLNICEEIEVWK